MMVTESLWSALADTIRQPLLTMYSLHTVSVLLGTNEIPRLISLL